MLGQCLGLHAALGPSQGRKPSEPSTGLMGSGLAKGVEPLLPQPPRIINWLPQRTNPGLTQLGTALSKGELTL